MKLSEHIEMLQAFQQQYGDLEIVMWEGGSAREVRFSHADYNSAGQWIETVSDKPVKELNE